MKQIVLILTALIVLVSIARGQRLLFATTIEKTIAGNQYGSLLVVQTKSLWTFGGFYQTSLQQTPEGVQTTNPFYGITISAPLVKTDKINFYCNVRCGVINQFFMVVAPGVETELKISKRLSASVMTSVRMTYPSAAIRIYFKL